MMDYEEDQTLRDRSVSRKDELNYRVTIQNIIDRCFRTMGSFSMITHVEALRMALFFNIPGLPLRNQILEVEKKLDKELLERSNNYKREMGREFYGNANRAKLKLKLTEWYWNTKLEYLLNLLAQHDALLKPKDFVEEGKLES